MTGAFDDFMQLGHAEAAEIFGETEFTIEGAPYLGILDELGDQGFSIVEGGREISLSAHLLCQLPQFAGVFPKAGTRLKINGRTLVIGTVAKDEVSITFALADPDAK